MTSINTEIMSKYFILKGFINIINRIIGCQRNLLQIARKNIHIKWYLPCIMHVNFTYESIGGQWKKFFREYFDFLISGGVFGGGILLGDANF